MAFGTCCISQYNNRLYKLKPKYVNIEGIQKGFIVNFEMTQAFRINTTESEEISYIFPNDMKMCIYDTTFTIGDKIIKPQLAPFDEAKTIYNEAIGQGQIVVYGANVGKGLSEFKIGNLPPRTTCKVILKIALECKQIDNNTLMIKFPLGIYTPLGEINCLDIKSNFSFKLHIDPNKINSVKSNVVNGIYDSENKVYYIEKEIKNNIKENSIILNFITKEKIKSSALLAFDSKNNADVCALAISFDKHISFDQNSIISNQKEFIFLVDCSGSMGGNPIKNAAECLEIFIKSLPSNSFFNIFRFGSKYEKLFDDSVQYNESTAAKALYLAQNLDADLGGTEMYDPLFDIFSSKVKHGQREIFILTDGEILDIEKVVKLVKENANQNRCNTIGFGNACDGGLVEGIANASGGKCDFVQYDDSLSEKVIPQLMSSSQPLIKNIEIHLQGDENNTFEVSPFPLPSISYKNTTLCYLRRKRDGNNKHIQIPFESGILISGTYNNEQIDITVDDFEQIEECKEDKYGCSKGYNIEKAINSLFAYKLLHNYQFIASTDQRQKETAIKLSLSSGVLCKYTGFIGMIKPDEETIMRAKMTIYSRRICGGHSGNNLEDSFFYENDSNFSDDYDCPSNEELNDQTTEDIIDKQSNTFDLISLIRLQHIDGYWDDVDDVNNICDLNINYIDEIKVKNKDIERKCIATIVAIVAMHTKAPEKRNTWNMIEQKALLWMNQILVNINIDTILRRIEESIKTQ